MEARQPVGTDRAGRECRGVGLRKEMTSELSPEKKLARQGSGQEWPRWKELQVRRLEVEPAGWFEEQKEGPWSAAFHFPPHLPPVWSPEALLPALGAKGPPPAGVQLLLDGSCLSTSLCQVPQEDVSLPPG